MMNVLPLVGFFAVVCPVMAPSWTLQNLGSPFQLFNDLPSNIGANPSAAPSWWSACTLSIDRLKIEINVRIFICSILALGLERGKLL